MNQTPTEQTAAAVRAELARRQMTAREASLAIGISTATMSRRLNAGHPFDVAELAALAAHLDVPISTFIPGSERAA